MPRVGKANSSTEPKTITVIPETQLPQQDCPPATGELITANADIDAEHTFELFLFSCGCTLFVCCTLAATCTCSIPPLFHTSSHRTCAYHPLSHGPDCKVGPRGY